MRDAFSNRPSSLSAEEFESIRKLVESELGVVLPLQKRPMVQARISRRCRELGLERAEDYYKYLFGEGMAEGEATHLLDAVTTNFTYFYREPPQLETLDQELLPPRVLEAAALGRPFRAWSAACATGEEAWTLAMMLDDAHARAGVLDRTRIIASDVNTRVLRTAANAVYRDQDVEPLRPEWRQRYLLLSKNRAEARVRVTPALRGRVTFARVNLMDPSYNVPADLDLVMLRNVLIYFDPPTRKQVVARVARHVRPGGLLVLGTSESVGDCGVPLEHLGLSIHRRMEPT